MPTRVVNIGWREIMTPAFWYNFGTDPEVEYTFMGDNKPLPAVGVTLTMTVEHPKVKEFRDKYELETVYDLSPRMQKRFMEYLASCGLDWTTMEQSQPTPYFGPASASTPKTEGTKSISSPCDTSLSAKTCQLGADPQPKESTPLDERQRIRSCWTEEFKSMYGLTTIQGLSPRMERRYGEWIHQKENQSTPALPPENSHG